jgi:hypothetical protein
MDVFMKKKYILALILSLLILSVVGCIESNSWGTKLSCAGDYSYAQDNLQQASQTTTTADNTYNDFQWIDVVTSDTNPNGTLIIDINNVRYACSNTDTVGVYKIGEYAKNLCQSTTEALEHSNNYKVSLELQATKDEYNQGLVEINKASVLITDAVDAYNKGDKATYLSSMRSAKTYAESGNQHFTTAISLLKTYYSNLFF